MIRPTIIRPAIICLNMTRLSMIGLGSSFALAMWVCACSDDDAGYIPWSQDAAASSDGTVERADANRGRPDVLDSTTPPADSSTDATRDPDRSQGIIDRGQPADARASATDATRPADADSSNLRDASGKNPRDAVTDLIKGDRSQADRDSQADRNSSDRNCSSGPIDCNCQAFSPQRNARLNLRGNVKEVTSNPDFKVRIVEGGETLKVMKVGLFAPLCGQWRTVADTPDFTYQVVTTGEDFTIRYVDLYPGLP